jgi:Arc-like DNA binding domain
MSSVFPSRGLDKFVLRLPEGMRDKIGAAARANKRAMNAEIIQRLEASFSPTAGPLLVINENTAEADIIFELRDSMQSLQAEFAELRANLVKAIGD